MVLDINALLKNGYASFITIKYRKTVPPKLDKSKIRLVIYSDSDRGRTPYYDSDAIRPMEDTDKNIMKSAPKTLRAKGLNYSSQKESSLPPQKPLPKYHFSRLGSDVKVLEEMMFGTAAMAFKGSTLKVHVLRSPPKLMVSKVFIPEKPCRDSFGELESDNSSLPGSSADFSSGEFSLPIRKTKEKYVKSIPVDVPSKELLSDYSTDDDSGLASFTSSGSLRTSFPSPSNNSSYNSLHRRWMRAQTTSLDGHHHKRLNQSSQSSDNSLSRPSRSKLAIGILFGNDENDEESNNLFQSFFFSHFALIESHVEKLRSVVEKAYFNTRNFIPTTMEALENFRDSIYDLYMAPRLTEPVWLTMMSTTTYKTKLCEKFMDTFVGLVTKFDNKNCKFFVSTLLSAVLTQHLAWVATVTPAGGTPSRTYLDKHTAKWVDTLAKAHPYNPLWAQLGDLFGAIGLPLKISRTLVVGRKADIVKRFLYVLSYFIRCSEVHENSDPQCLSKIVNDPQFGVSLSPTSSEKTLDGQEISPAGTHYFRQTSSGQIKPTDKTFTWGNCESGNQANSELLTSPGYNCEEKHSDSFQDRNSVNRLITSAGEFDSFSSSSFCSVLNQKNEAFGSNKLISPSDEAVQRPEWANPNGVVSNANVGISELHTYTPNSLPVCSITSAKIVESPRIEKVINVSKAPRSPIDFSSEHSFVRAESFSEGKSTRKSRLSQQLESSADTRTTVTDSPHSCLNEDAETKVTSSEAEFSLGSNSSWLSNESRKENEPLAKLSISRQTSQDHKPPRPTTLTRGRSITPTELSRRRHLSSNSSIDYEAFDPEIHCTEIKLPSALTDCGQWQIKAFDRNFGRSLLASYTDHYMSDFVLHGTSDTEYKTRLLNDLQMTVKHSILDEPIDEAVCVIADTDHWTVEVASSKVMGMSPSGCTPWTASKLVADMIESVVEISKLKMSAEFCLMHLEDRLQEIYFKSSMLSEYLQGAPYNQRELTSMLGFESSDMPLLLAIAGTHNPNLLSSS
ncbi:folliculin-interacting protein 2-like isoform X2 [Physella acuta]|uniref:folliculin-interacting protein 2-like isoform X2 n=1 Tax=Physella acuta TaxID=109671 RepID=UPI0027DAE410|nr:folliculin-interacting protein 2-like isoform X2 [Physella acuta]